jgi:hypothetical protein
MHSQSIQDSPAIVQKWKEKGYVFETYNERGHFSLNFLRDHRL